MAVLEPAFRGRSGWERVYPDLPGHGRSPADPSIRDMDDYLDRLLDFADERFEGSPYAVGGISFGAYFALAMFRRRPGRITGLMASVPEIHHAPTEDRLDRALGTPSILLPQRFDPSLPPYREATGWLESLPFQDVTVPLYRARRPSRIPALFLFGRQDAAFRYRAYWRMLSEFPAATFAVLDGAGHRLWMERGRLGAQLVGDWLDRIAERKTRSSPAPGARRPAVTGNIRRPHRHRR